ncbi:membrane protein insertase YidC [Zooshikella harenae]|uniref:Membrane protein insertase YidC n=1 Tax=Zooshikella harenae TaxID=2827238 RepID=A0ABS5ZC89_9GAMM|nr:membrane protein insertase YidC [Zooshikella harenae]MBU2711682.1 membrane protein insertase YidC [Zooshikella harenae]
MDLQRTLIIAGLVVVGYLMILQWNQDFNQHNVTAEQTASVTSSVPDVDSTTTLDSADAPIIVETTDDAPRLTEATTTTAQPSQQIIKITTDKLYIEINPEGGDIIKASLLDYPVTLPSEQNPSPEPFTILESSKQRTFVAQSGLVGKNGPHSKGTPTYSSPKTTYELKDGENQLVVDLSLSTAEGVELVKRYTFHRDNYAVDLEYLVNNKSSNSWKAVFYAQLKRDNSPDPSSTQGATSFNTYLGAAVRSTEEKYHKLPFDEFKEEPFKEKVEKGYAAILQHYFVAAWVPKHENPVQYSTRENDQSQYIVSMVDVNNPIVLAPGEQGKASATLYVGPKIQDKLQALTDGLELTVDYGILWFAAKPLFLLLGFIHSLIPNWGWSIIILTIMVKMAFFPLSAASYRSMANMRRIAPKMQELKEKFGDDRQKMSQAMMELYRKEKVNPMGGCLPILVQMPVFIALYWVLMESVELRQASWLGWIHDLSQMDPYFILPLIMGASMFVQQQLNPTPPDPTQARVMKLLPVIFTVFFLWFPAGLVLYWVVNNVLSILQQWVITRRIESQAESKS